MSVSQLLVVLCYGGGVCVGEGRGCMTECSCLCTYVATGRVALNRLVL
jgi:hypothetical protein